MSNASTASGREEADARDIEESGEPILFPHEGNFSAVVPLSEVGDAPVSHPAAIVYGEDAESFIARRAARNSQDEHEEVTLVPGRVGRSTVTFRTRFVRPSWPVTIAALTLSLAAGLTAGIYLIKSVRAVEIQPPAAVAESVSTEAVDATVAPVPQPTVVPSESPLTPSTTSATNTDADVTAHVGNVEARLDKTGSDLSIPKRGPTADAPSVHSRRSTEASPARATLNEQPSERPDRKGPPVTSNPPARREAVATRRATVAAGRPPVLRTPERSLPVSLPPAATKSKKVIQWP
jgi:hypothetical protein